MSTRLASPASEASLALPARRGGQSPSFGRFGGFGQAPPSADLVVSVSRPHSEKFTWSVACPPGWPVPHPEPGLPSPPAPPCAHRKISGRLPLLSTDNCFATALRAVRLTPNNRKCRIRRQPCPPRPPRPAHPAKKRDFVVRAHGVGGENKSGVRATHR